MRITGGKYVRRKILCPPGVIRPAMDRMRESLFAILGDLSGLSFLDLFSGSGIVAIEAASRGAEPIVLVEMDRGKKETIEKNLSFVEEEKKVYMTDVERFISTYQGSFSIVYADPPFPMKDKIGLSDRIAKTNIIKPSGLYIIHIPSEEDPAWPDELEGKLKLSDKRKYGRSILRFYTKEEI